MGAKFITFEGGEGSGKTTQIKMLAQYFAGLGRKYLVTREPGGSNGAEAIRQLLLTGSADKWNSISETLLFQAARVEHVENVIKPAIARSETVLCDRFLDSTIVYQGIAKGLGEEYIRQLHQLTIGNFMPDLTFILDIEPETGLKRAKARTGEELRFENMDIEFHRKVREGFMSLADSDKSRCIVVDAGHETEVIHKFITDYLLSLAV